MYLFFFESHKQLSTYTQEETHKTTKLSINSSKAVLRTMYNKKYAIFSKLIDVVQDKNWR